MYLVTDMLINTTGASADVVDACKMARSQLQATTFLRDSRSIKFRGEDGVYTELGRYTKQTGRIVPSFAVIKHWKGVQKAAGKDVGLNDFWRALGVCTKCKGDKGEFEFSCADQDWVLAKDCSVCKGSGEFTEPKVTKMTLYVREDIYKDGGEGTRSVDLSLEEGSGAACMKCFMDIREAYNTDTSQFRVEENGRIVAIQVHGEMLWLDNVPPPEYFYPKWKQRDKDLDAAQKIKDDIDKQRKAFVAGIEAGKAVTAGGPPEICMAGAWNND